MLEEGALDDMLSQPFLMEILFRHVSNEREAEAIRAAISAGNKSILGTYIDRVAPWMRGNESTDRLEAILMSDIVQNTTLSFSLSESVED